ncbi:TPA: hypothetical protein DIS60_05375 [Patescibacteria group bacterium]|nr:hypothetical protein [Patescibacteria group bacterium]
MPRTQNKARLYLILSLFITALALRIFLIPNRGFEADIAFWKSWGLSALDNGVVVGIGVTNNNYPAPFSYVLGFLAFLYRLFANPHIFDSYWNSGNVLFLLIAKLPSILADLGIAGILLYIGHRVNKNMDVVRWGTPVEHPQSRNVLVRTIYNIQKVFMWSEDVNTSDAERGTRTSDGGRRTTQSFPPLSFHFYFLLSILYLFNPVSLIDGALWGQVDSLGVLIFMAAVILAASDKPILAGAVYTLSMMTKLQNMIYGPLFFLLLWQLGAFQGLVRGIIGAVSAFFFLNMEFLLKKNMSTVMESLTSNYDYFPMMSLNAFNLWWIAAKGAGMQMSDKLLSIGIINAKTTGLLLFSSGYLLAGVTMVKETMKKMFVKRTVADEKNYYLENKTGDPSTPSIELRTSSLRVNARRGTPVEHPQSRNVLVRTIYNIQKVFMWSEDVNTSDAERGTRMSDRGKRADRDIQHTNYKNDGSNNFFYEQQRSDILFHFFTALIIVAFSFFLFQTESHDRYAFPVSVFMLIWGIFYVHRTNTEKMRTFWWKTRTFRIFIIGYIVFSILFFLNLHTALSYNYPHNSIPALLLLRNPGFTIPISILQISFFFFFLYIARRTIKLGAFLIAILFFGGTCLMMNLPLLTKSPVSLTRLTPHTSQQGFGSRVTDMPVNAAGPSKNWNRLSVQYSFYKKGIGTHANSFIVYDVNGLFKRFTADIGIDTEAGAQGSVVFKIYGDDRLLYQSDLVKRFEYPRHADIDITGVKKFALIVEDGGDGINDDHADWLRPTLWP